MNLSIIILAAGLGQRMRSARPKVVHRLADKPLIGHVVDTALFLKPAHVFLVYGHGGEEVGQALKHLNNDIHWVEQSQPLGTGHAVAQAMPLIPDENQVLILYGDVPLIGAATLENLMAQVGDSGLGLITVTLDNPAGYGRIVRDAQDQVISIIEDKEADAKVKNIREVNTGIITAPAFDLRRWLGQVKNVNAQGEFYLTDIIALAVAEQRVIHTIQASSFYEVMGVNDRGQLAELERAYQKQLVAHLLVNGVTVRDPARLDIRGRVQCDRDVTIDVNVVLEGEVNIGKGVSIGPYTLIKNADIGDEVEILSHCLIENAVIGNQCRIGPFARLRPESVLADHVHIGNFVEIKKSQIGEHSKINHLSYVGDSEVGREVNVGAGTITCNYDGANKHKTIIKDRVFIGSDTQLVAPVTVETGSTIGAGSTITKNTSPNCLTLSRCPQKIIPGWQRPVKKK